MNNREWLYSLDIADLSDWFDAEHVDGVEIQGELDEIETDSREKLEAEIRYEYNGSIENEAEQIIGWLDRQAAITERECLVQSVQGADAILTAENAELQVKVDELTAQLHASNAEREHLRECLGIATDNAHDFLTLVDESGNVYDRDEGLA